jgi:hypothetical protein
MKFPLSLDLRRRTLAERAAGVLVIDADQLPIMRMLPDAGGSYDSAGVIVDTLNAAALLIKAGAKL